jgi:4-deoxy-L-threo-5-hexosulose-uronate ketol-isomerase
MEIKYVGDKNSYKRMTAAELRESYLLENLFEMGKIQLYYLDVDRTIVGSIVPASEKLTLSSAKELAADYFALRREIGIINIGESGTISVDGKQFELGNKDCLYIGRGSKEIAFMSSNPDTPAKFYLMSYPAHQTYQTKLITKKEANKVELGSGREANKRIIYQMIRPGVAESCQIVMGLTELAEGSVWNTMPPHTHQRRSEVYMYFDLPENARLFHFMGEPLETRSLVMKNGQAVISPGWSIHAGAGTGNYTFIWCMGGENQEFTDMDFVEMRDLR